MTTATTASSAEKNQVRRDVEGLRAVAVGSVLLYHAGVGALPGGFAGVDVFFVISGFLITALLLREVDRTGTVSIGRFYARRARRLLPAATLVLLVTAVAGYAVLPGSAHGNLGRDVAAAAAYVVNWTLASRSVDYLAEGAGASPVQHYWSLSVEEQYYVVWPLLVIGLAALARRVRRPARPLLLGAVVTALAASLAYSVVHTASSPQTAYFITPTRVWELAIGSLVAFGVARARALPRRWAEGLAAVGIGMVLLATFVLSTATTWPGIAALLPTAGTALVLLAGCAAAGSRTLVARALGWSPLVWLGGVSYAVYLWHWPLIVLTEARYPDLAGWQVLGVALLALPLAWLTKHLLEDPVRFARTFVVRPAPALALGAVLMSVTILSGLLVARSVPAAPTAGTVIAASGARALVADPAAVPWTPTDDPVRTYDRSGDVVPDPAVAPEDAPLKGGCQVPLGQDTLRTDCVFGDRDSDTTIAMMGDSKMGQWFPAVQRIARAEGWRLEVYLKSACTPSAVGVSPDCARYNAKALAWLERTGAPDYVLVSQRGSSYEESTGGLVDGLDALRALGSRVVPLADNISPDSAAPYACVEQNADDYRACGFDRASGERRSGTGALRDAARALDLPMLDLNEWICPEGATCPSVIGGVLVYRQGSHVTATYVRTLTPVLHRALVRIGVGTTPERDIGLDEVP